MFFAAKALNMGTYFRKKLPLNMGDGLELQGTKLFISILEGSSFELTLFLGYVGAPFS